MSKDAIRQKLNLRSNSILQMSQEWEEESCAEPIVILRLTKIDWDWFLLFYFKKRTLSLFNFELKKSTLSLHFATTLQKFPPNFHFSQIEVRLVINWFSRSQIANLTLMLMIQFRGRASWLKIRRTLATKIKMETIKFWSLSNQSQFLKQKVKFIH